MNNRMLELVLSFFTDKNVQIDHLTEKQWESIIRISREAGVIGRIQHIIVDSEQQDKVPAFARKHLRSATAYSAKQAQQVKSEADSLITLLKRAQVNRHIFLKGSAYVLSDSPVAKGRTFSDIDMLVDKSLIETTEQKLLLYGWFQDETTEYDQKYYRQWTHEIPPLKHSVRGTVLDLHHNLLPPVTGRAPDIEDFWNEVVSLESGVQVLSPAAMTLHSTIHLFFQEEFSSGFRDLTDLHTLFSHHNNPEYWNSLLTLSARSGFDKELFLATRYCKQILNTDIPDFVFEKLEKHQPGRIALAWNDWMFGRVLLPQHLLVSTRSTPYANFAAFVRGHLIKMPLHILIYHTLHKAIAGLNFLFTGRKPSAQAQNNKQEQ